MQKNKILPCQSQNFDDWGKVKVELKENFKQFHLKISFRWQFWVLKCCRKFNKQLLVHLILLQKFKKRVLTFLNSIFIFSKPSNYQHFCVPLQYRKTLNDISIVLIVVDCKCRQENQWENFKSTHKLT